MSNRKVIELLLQLKSAKAHVTVYCGFITLQLLRFPQLDRHLMWRKSIISGHLSKLNKFYGSIKLSHKKSSGCSCSKKNISSDGICLAYTLCFASIRFSLNSFEIFRLVVTGFGHKDMKWTVVITQFSLSGIDMKENYALINRECGPYAKIFVVTSCRTDRTKWGPCGMTSQQIFSVWTKLKVNKSFIVYPHKWNYKKSLFSFVIMDWSSASPYASPYASLYASPYAGVWTGSQPVKF